MYKILLFKTIKILNILKGIATQVIKLKNKVILDAIKNKNLLD